MNTSPEPWYRHRIVRWMREFAIFAGIFLAVTAYQTRDLLDRGTPLPIASLPQLDGERVDFAAFKGKPTLLYFWAPWCSVCKTNAHNVEDVVDEDYNIASIALSYEDLAQVRTFATQYNMPKPVLLGGREESTSFNISAFPTIYVLNREGEVAFATMGYTSELGLRARLFAAEL